MNYNEIMQKPGKEINVSLVLESGGAIPSKDIVKAKPYFKSNLVGTIMKGLDVELKVQLPNDAKVYFHNLARYIDDEDELVLGPYYIKDYEYNADDKTYTYHLYDEFVVAMVEYKPINISFPCTVYDFFVALIQSFGWATTIMALPNGLRVMEHDIYDDIGYTYRSVLEDIGQATGTLFRINNGVVQDSYITTSYIDTQNEERINTQNEDKILVQPSIFRVSADVKINDSILKNQNIEFGEHFGPINSIVLSRSGDSDRIYKRDESVSDWKEFKISDNQLMNDNNRYQYLDELYSRLCGIEYDVFDTQLVGYGHIEPLQKIEFTTNEKTYISYVFNCEEEFTQGYAQSIYTDFPSESKTNYSVADKRDNQIKQTYIIVNKQKQQIESLVSTTEEISGDVNNNTLQISQIIQDASGLTGYFANSEGAKYIRLSSDGIQVSKDSESGSVNITDDGVYILNDDNVKVCSMKANEFDTTNWIYSETRNGNCLNIYKRRER